MANDETLINGALDQLLWSLRILVKTGIVPEHEMRSICSNIDLRLLVSPHKDLRREELCPAAGKTVGGPGGHKGGEWPQEQGSIKEAKEAQAPPTTSLHSSPFGLSSGPITTRPYVNLTKSPAQTVSTSVTGNSPTDDTDTDCDTTVPNSPWRSGSVASFAPNSYSGSLFPHGPKLGGPGNNQNHSMRSRWAEY